MSAGVSLEAGRELDALVAERVMGWTRCGVDFGGAGQAPGMDHRTYLPPYSTDIAAAWEVVEKLGLSVVRSEDGWYAVQPEDISHGCVRGTDFPTITLVWPEGEHPEPADTAPLAICLAAIEATAHPTESEVACSRAETAEHPDPQAARINGALQVMRLAGLHALADRWADQAIELERITNSTLYGRQADILRRCASELRAAIRQEEWIALPHEQQNDPTEATT